MFHADDYADFSMKLRDILEPHVDWVGTTTSGADVIGELAELDADVVLLDISMPAKSGLELIREIRETLPDVKIIIVTMHSDTPYVDAALHAGASGYVLKSFVASEIVTAIDDVYQGRTFVSRALAAP